MDVQSDEITMAVRKALKDGYRTADIMQNGMQKVGTSQMGDVIKSNILA